MWNQLSFASVWPSTVMVVPSLSVKIEEPPLIFTPATSAEAVFPPDEMPI